MFLEAEGPQNPMGPDTPSDYRIGQPVKDRTGTYVLDTIQNNINILNCNLFACPRIGNIDFNNYVENIRNI